MAGHPCGPTPLALALVFLITLNAHRALAAPLGAEDYQSALLASISERFGVSASIQMQADWPQLNIEASAAQISVRYPARRVSSLPEAIEVRIDSRLEACIPLARYVKFTLPVATAPQGLALRCIVGADMLALEERTLAAGSEVCCDIAQLSGLETRSALQPGSIVLPSRLRKPADVKRGDTIALLMHLDGVDVRADATALADGYLGQRIAVRRESDRRQFSGVLIEGPAVEVQ